MPDFSEKLNEYAERAFGDNAQDMIDSFLYAKCLNLAYLEKGTYDRCVTTDSELFVSETALFSSETALNF